MKKEYKKPIALVENFEMDEFIAGACRDAGKGIYDAPKMIGSTIDDCPVDKNGTIYFSAYCATLDSGINTFDYAACYQGILGAYFSS